MKITYKNTKKFKTRVEQLNFAVHGVWYGSMMLTEDSLTGCWCENYPNLTLRKVKRMDEKSFNKLLKFALKKENELYF